MVKESGRAQTHGEFRKSREHQEVIFQEIGTERMRQDSKRGIQNHHPEKWLSILMKEVGSASKAAIEAYPFRVKLNKSDHRAWLGRYRREMIQVAAVAVAAIDALDRLSND